MIAKSGHTTPAFLLGILFILMASINSGCSGCSKSGRLARSGAPGQTEKMNNENVRRGKKEQSSVSAQDGQLSITPGNMTLNELFMRCKPAVFMITTTDGKTRYQGTGFFISENGIAISNYHIFEKAVGGMEKILAADGTQLKINEILTRNSNVDYVVFRVAITKPVVFLNVARKGPEIGEEVFTIGNPYGLEHTLSQGIVSAYRKEGTLIQTTAEFAPGSSGGPLLNMKGEVIGITTATIGEANLNFAVNIDLLYLDRFMRN